MYGLSHPHISCLKNVIEKLKRLKIVDIININEDNYKQTNENDIDMVDYIKNNDINISTSASRYCISVFVMF